MAKAKPKSTTKPKARPHGRTPLKPAAKPNADAALFRALDTFNGLATQHEAAIAETDRLEREVMEKITAAGLRALTVEFDRETFEFVARARMSAIAARAGKINFRKKIREIREFAKDEADRVEAAREKGYRIVRRIQRQTGLEAARRKGGGLYVKAAKALETAFLHTPAKTAAGVRAKLKAFKGMSGFEYWRGEIIEAISRDVGRLKIAA